VTSVLTPFIEELFAPISALGSSPRVIAGMLGRAGVGRGSRVLDLACGKGAVAVEIAARLGCRVMGIDACAGFIDAAKRLAAAHSVEERCVFRVGDVRNSHPGRRVDVAMMIGLDPFDSAAASLRRHVGGGGLYVLDDCVRMWNLERSKKLGIEDVPTRGAAQAYFESLGDEVVSCHVPPPSRVRRRNKVLYRRLSESAASLGEQRPRLKGELRAFLDGLRKANKLLEGPLRGTVWLVRRG